MGEAVSVELAVVVGRAEEASVLGKEEECGGVAEEGGSAIEALAILLLPHRIPSNGLAL